MKLTGKHALVTGGTRGIGLEIARKLLQEGVRVTLTGRHAAPISLATLQGGEQVQMVTMDVADPQSVKQGMAQAVQCFGAIDILVNNAGQAHSAPMMKTDLALWQRMLDINLSGTFHCIQAVLPSMLANGWGRIVNVASTAGLTGYAYVGAYCAAKHGVIGLTRALALELATKGVTVNAVCPGYTETEIVTEAIENIVQKTGCTPEQAKAQLVAANPQKRLIQPQEVAHTVAWLCHPDSAAINGQAIAVAGGEVM